MSPWPLGWALGLTLLFGVARFLPADKFFNKPTDYLPLHTGLEFLSLAVAAMVFALGWNLRRSQQNSHMVLLAAAFLYVGPVDFAHVLSYKGMPDWVTPSGPEKAINFWLAGRLGAALGLLSVALLPLRSWSACRCLGVFGTALVAAMLVWWVGLYHPDWLPRTFEEGLTAFKIDVEYLLAGTYAVAALLLYRRGQVEDSRPEQWLGVAAWTLAMAEMFFTLYADVTDVFNVAGHLYKLGADWMIYRALFAIGVQAPFRALERQGERLELLVEARTADLNATVARFRTFVEQAPTAIAMFDKNMNYLAVSQRWLQEYGMDLDCLVGCNHFAIYPNLPESWRHIFQTVMAGIPQEKRQELIVWRDGRRQWIRWAAYPWHDERGEIGGIAMLVEDITSYKLAEEQLLESQAHFRATFEQAGVGLCHAGTDGRFLRVNDKYCAIIGYERDELLRLRFQDITYPEDIEANLEGRAQLMAEAIQSYSMEKRYIRKDGTVIWVNLTIALVRTAAGQPDYFLAVIEDIQERKEMERVLAEERDARHTVLAQQVAERTEELQAANRQLEGFLYAASHDLKGPLGRISSFSMLLEKNYRDRLEGDGLLFLDFIRSNSIRLIKLIDDLLSHARIDQQVNQLQAVDVAVAVQMVLRERSEDIQEARAVVRVNLPAVPVLADPYGVNQTLHNLLENALKYSARVAEPIIEIGGEEMAGRFRLWVRDNGIGFDMDYHDRIFDMFRRLHTYDEYAGSGIGLALVKRAMERAGGTAWAESEPGQGATFFVEFNTAPRSVASGSDVIISDTA